MVHVQWLQSISYCFIQVNILSIVPPIVVFLAKSPLAANVDWSSVLRVSCGAAPLSKEVELEFKKRLKVREMRQGSILIAESWSVCDLKFINTYG